MPWNYRIVKTRTKDLLGSVVEDLSVRTAWFDDPRDKENPTSIGATPMAPAGVTVEEVKADLLRMLKACDKPVLNEEDFEGGRHGDKKENGKKDD